jgi:hypothetical protein
MLKKTAHAHATLLTFAVCNIASNNNTIYSAMPMMSDDEDSLQAALDKMMNDNLLPEDILEGRRDSSEPVFKKSRNNNKNDDSSYEIRDHDDNGSDEEMEDEETDDEEKELDLRMDCNRKV